MVLPPIFLDIIKYTLPGLAIVMVAYYLIKPYLDRYEKIKLLDYKKNAANPTLSLKLQAYERLVLFIERINPANMLVRLNAPSFSAAELHAMVVTEIRNEFQHNVTQQLYVTEHAWALVRQVKDDTLTMINNAAKTLPENATGLDFSKIIIGHVSQLKDNVYDAATGLLRKDAEQLF